VHEYSIASQIWQSVFHKAREAGGGRVKSISLEIGVLNLLADEQLTFWVRALAERDGSPDVQLKIVHLPGRVHCNDCGDQGEPTSPGGVPDHILPPPVLCPACGSSNVKLTGGRELRVVSAEIEVPNAGGSDTR
jgi:hydrogenase nickel incorporation protein HypA/HybF